VARGPRRTDSDRGAEDDSVDLSAPEHAWWARDPVETSDGTDPADSSDTNTTEDPYALLKVEPGATWDDIVASYRRLARWWHPDRLTNPAPGERELCDDMIRRLNIAYTELRVRRGR
jgi:DnaJ-domain-containing protein 1